MYCKGTFNVKHSSFKDKNQMFDNCQFIANKIQTIMTNNALNSYYTNHDIKHKIVTYCSVAEAAKKFLLSTKYIIFIIKNLLYLLNKFVSLLQSLSKILVGNRI